MKTNHTEAWRWSTIGLHNPERSILVRNEVNHARVEFLCDDKQAEKMRRMIAVAPELLQAAEIGLACCIAWGGKCEANGENILAKESVIQAEKIRAALALAKGETKP